MERRILSRAIGGVALCLVLALGGQAMADSLVPGASGVDTGRAVGRAASSYLSGIRTYAAAVLWNRVHPLLHGYYEDVPLKDQRYMLSTIALVQALDPSLVHSYYVGSWILAENGRTAEGLAMTERALEHNPDSGLSRVSRAQLTWLYGKDSTQALIAAESVLDERLVWNSPVEQHDAYAAVLVIFKSAGREDLMTRTRDALERLDEEFGDALEGVDHDHDGDGVPDH